MLPIKGLYHCGRTQFKLQKYNSLLPFVARSSCYCRPFSSESELSARQRRILYRCRQRGILELDLLLGTWAAENIKRLNESALDQLEFLSGLESPDLLKLILKQQELPGFDMPVLRALQYYAQSDGKAWITHKKSGNQ